MTRDPGLQPERTSMSWLRTQLVLFGAGLLVFKVADNYGVTSISIAGLVAMVFSIYCSFYTQKRFSKLFTNASAMKAQEQNIKKILSAIVCLLSISYVVLIWVK